MKHNKQKLRKRLGFTIIEVAIVLVFAGAAAVAVFLIYNQLYLPSVANNKHEEIASVIAGVDRSRRLNNNVYPTGSGGDITTIPNITNSLGGANAVKNLTGWTYSCPAGSGSTITITTTPYEDQVVRDLVVSLVNSNNAPWTATASGNRVVVTKSNVTCN